MLSIKQGSIKYHFLSLWYDSRLYTYYHTKEEQKNAVIKNTVKIAGLKEENRNFSCSSAAIFQNVQQIINITPIINKGLT